MNSLIFFIIVMEIPTEAYQNHIKLSLEERKSKSQHYLSKYQDSVPVFIEAHS